MSSFGETLRNAREAKGLTCSQVASQTHMLVQIVEEMEREDFHRIPAPIYGRGFVKLYCEAVGLEAKPFIDEFMAIYNGTRDIGIKERPTPPPPAPEPLPFLTEDGRGSYNGRDFETSFDWRDHR